MSSERHTDQSTPYDSAGRDDLGLRVHTESNFERCGSRAYARLCWRLRRDFCCMRGAVVDDDPRARVDEDFDVSDLFAVMNFVVVDEG